MFGPELSEVGITAFVVLIVFGGKTPLEVASSIGKRIRNGQKAFS